MQRTSYVIHRIHGDPIGSFDNAVEVIGQNELFVRRTWVLWRDPITARLLLPRPSLTACKVPHLRSNR